MEAAEPLLQKVMVGGKIVRQQPSLDEIRLQFQEDFQCLDDRFKALQGPPCYEVTLSPRLEQLYKKVERDLVAQGVVHRQEEAQG